MVTLCHWAARVQLYDFQLLNQPIAQYIPIESGTELHDPIDGLSPNSREY